MNTVLKKCVCALVFSFYAFVTQAQDVQIKKSKAQPILSSRYSLGHFEQQVAGMQYLEVRDTVAKFDAYVLRISTRRLQAKTEVFQAQNRLGKYQRLTELQADSLYKDKEVLAAINGNFWIVRGQNQPDELLGQPHSGSMKKGMLITAPNNWNRGRGKTPGELNTEIGFFYLNQKGKAFIDDLAFNGRVYLSKEFAVPIQHVNGLNQEHGIGLFNEFAAKGESRISEHSISVKLRRVGHGKISVADIYGYQVVSVSSPAQPESIAKDEAVLIFSGAFQDYAKSLTVGTSLSIGLSYSSRSTSKPVYPQEMLTGNAWVLKDSELTIRNENEDYNNRPYPRTGIGVSKNGSDIFLIVIDRSKQSKGATTAQMASLLKELGATEVTSLDGGGSAQLFYKGEIKNKPSDGRERPVANGLIIYK